MKRVMLLILILLKACEDKDVFRGDYIVFGHFYGSCVGEKCIEIYKLTDRHLFEDTKDQYPTSAKPYAGSFVMKSQDLFHEVNGLSSLIPSQLLSTPSGVIGYPDAGDWGGIYLEVSENGVKKFWLIDKVRANIPDYLNPLIDAIEERIERLS